jgi:hypothetical protein
MKKMLAGMFRESAALFRAITFDMVKGKWATPLWGSFACHNVSILSGIVGMSPDLDGS